MQTFIDYTSYLLIVLVLVYVRQILFFYRGLARLKKGTNTVLYSVTVLVPARNEEKNIETCLNSLINQSYPKEKLAIIVIDDQSTDGTAAIVKKVAARSPFNITLIQPDDRSVIRSPKIRALSYGIQYSPTDIIVTTDADCAASPEWTSSLNSYFEDTVGIVTGLTVYKKDDRLSPVFWGIQFLDFISYTAIAAGAIGMNRVLVSNGSNMAFRRRAFDESGGFETLKHINTGDDSLLAQKIVEKGTWKPRFAFEESAAITTQPVLTWNEVFHQRMRWVGQTAYYPAYMMFFMICTFVMFIGLTLTVPLTFFFWNIIPWAVILGIFSIDYIAMHRFTRITKTDHVMKYFLPTAVIHIPFVLISTIGGYFFSFKWKERTLKKETF